jgi:hypothetical protein
MRKFLSALLLSLTLLCHEAHATILLFWRVEGTTLDATHDFTAGDNTAAANNTPSITGTAAKVGSNGALFDSSADSYRFNPQSPTPIIDRTVGSVAMWFQFQTTFIGSGQNFFFARANANANDNLTIGGGTSGQIRFSIRHSVDGEVNIQTSGASFTTGQWYFVVASWDQPNSDRRVAVYDSSGVMMGTAGEDLTTAFSAPIALDSGDGLRFGDATGWGASSSAYIDNIFVGNAYTDGPIFYNNRDITSFTSYSTSSSSGLLLRRRR